MSIMQGSALPDITNTQSKTTTAPSWYNDYLSGLAQKGQSALASSGVAGPSNLQQTAYANAPEVVRSGQPGSIRAGQELAAVSGATTPEMMQSFMNPYTSNVVDEIGRLGVQNFNQVLAPGATAGTVGSGQFGSRRGMEVYANTARDAASNILGQQSGALQSGYKNAMDAAQAEKRIGLDTARGFADLGQTVYNQGTGGLGVLSTLGGQEQAIEQARLNQPMAATKDYASLFSGLNIPTSTTQTTVGPGAPGQYQKSPLELAMMYGSGVGALFSPNNGGQSIAGDGWDALKSAYNWFSGDGSNNTSQDTINDLISGNTIF